MCIAFDGAYILEAPATHPATHPVTTDEGRPVPELKTDDAATEGTERPVLLESAIR